MKRKLQTKAGRAVYAARKTIVEPVFGQIKQARGFRQFLLRGLAKVQGEWALVCLTHNILSCIGSALRNHDPAGCHCQVRHLFQPANRRSKQSFPARIMNR
jgi:Transposase DDE domain